MGYNKKKCNQCTTKNCVEGGEEILKRQRCIMKKSLHETLQACFEKSNCDQKCFANADCGKCKNLLGRRETKGSRRRKAVQPKVQKAKEVPQKESFEVEEKLQTMSRSVQEDCIEALS